MNPSRTTTGFTIRWPRTLAVVLCVAGLAVLPAVAQAASNPTVAQYRNVTSQVNDDVGGSGGSHTASASGLQQNFISGLPFTGFDAIALVAVAMVLTSVGLALRWLTSHHHLP